jgi:serine phosphatase RsbU (regulator of sigma subunit)
VHFSSNSLRSRTPTEVSGIRVIAESRCGGAPVGGDFYRTALRGPGRLAMVIGDACGRGTDGARLLPAVVPKVERMLGTHPSPAHLLNELNRRVDGQLPMDRFVTMLACELDVPSGQLTIANAAHVPAMVRKASGRVMVVGQASGPPVGMLNNTEYIEEKHDLARGDVIVFMTDGVLEAIETDLIEMRTLRGSLERGPAGGRALHEFLLEQLDRCTGGRGPDDMMLVTLEVVSSHRATRAVCSVLTGGV